MFHKFYDIAEMDTSTVPPSVSVSESGHWVTAVIAVTIAVTAMAFLAFLYKIGVKSDDGRCNKCVS